LKHDYDASAFAGRTIYIALRYVTDASVSDDGIRFHEMQLDGESVTDATALKLWNSKEEVFPPMVEE
jgi:hypothetical protein